MPTCQLLIKGKVQGVFYRDTARKMAKKLGVTGWVKNTREGDVEAMVSGQEQAVEEFISWCRQGPPKAQVDDVVVTPKPEISFENFIIDR